MSTATLGASSPGGGDVHSVWSIKLSVAEKVITLLIFLYWLVFENIAFFYPMDFGGSAFSLLTNVIKLVLPFGVLMYAGLPLARRVGNRFVPAYLLLFAVFLGWGLIPTIISGDPLSWFKLLPRLVFFAGVLTFFAARPSAFTLFAKFLVVYVLSALAQYLLANATGAYGNTAIYGVHRLAGPFGLLGNVTSTLSFPGAPSPIVRLTGFWNEPSNASGSAFAAFFLGRFLTSMGDGAFWRWASYASLAAGLLALSNAGYFSLGAALVIGVVFGGRRSNTHRSSWWMFAMLAAIALLWVGVFGRGYVAENLPENVWARAAVGAHSQASFLDPYDGRLGLLKRTIDVTSSRFIGVGVQETGAEGIAASASAPVYWQLMTGIPGVFLLLAREAVLLGAAWSLVRRVPVLLPIVQALVVVMAQHLVYGSWMNPNYFILAAVVLACSSRPTQHLLMPHLDSRERRAMNREGYVIGVQPAGEWV